MTTGSGKVRGLQYSNIARWAQPQGLLSAHGQTPTESTISQRPDAAGRACVCADCDLRVLGFYSEGRQTSHSQATPSVHFPRQPLMGGHPLGSQAATAIGLGSSHIPAPPLTPTGSPQSLSTPHRCPLPVRALRPISKGCPVGLPSKHFYI